jgi:hypothetical protein
MVTRAYLGTFCRVVSLCSSRRGRQEAQLGSTAVRSTVRSVAGNVPQVVFNHGISVRGASVLRSRRVRRLRCLMADACTNLRSQHALSLLQ